MSNLRHKNQLVERICYVFGVLLLSGILGVIVSIIANYFVLVVKWFANLRTTVTTFFNSAAYPFPQFYGFLRPFLFYISFAGPVI